MALKVVLMLLFTVVLWSHVDRVDSAKKKTSEGSTSRRLSRNPTLPTSRTFSTQLPPDINPPPRITYDWPMSAEQMAEYTKGLMSKQRAATTQQSLYPRGGCRIFRMQPTVAEHLETYRSMMRSIGVGINDACLSNDIIGLQNCNNAFQTFLAFPAEWRGYCKNAVYAVCEPYPHPGFQQYVMKWCSFYVRISPDGVEPASYIPVLAELCAQELLKNIPAHTEAEIPRPKDPRGPGPGPGPGPGSGSGSASKDKGKQVMGVRKDKGKQVMGARAPSYRRPQS